MAYKNNTYYQISSFGDEAVQASEALLKSYPLTRVCLDILGKQLVRKLEFGFFEPHHQIIVQGEQGKDLFLICNHLADVIVFDRLIIQMEAPALFGDKAIIDRNSTRNATIAIAEGDLSLVIKIPMGYFIRDFKQSDADDASFVQETRIYYNLFLEIQSRLFKYSQIQKKLWDEVNKQLKLLNIQLVTSQLIKKEEKEWEPKVWQVIRQYLKSVHSFAWPSNVQYSTGALMDILNSVLESRFPKTEFKGNYQTYLYQKKLIWNRWLDTLSELLIKVLPNEQLPISIGEVLLFNPRIYQMRMHTLLVSIQRKFMFKKVQPRKEVFDSDKLVAKNFFSKKISDNEFDLDSYLKTVKQMFILRNPNRVLAQVAQQTAQLTATCENEFNESVSKMQHFLDKVKKLSLVKKELVPEEEKLQKQILERTTVINQGFSTFHSKIVGHTYTYAGVIRFTDTKVPLLENLIKATGSDALKKNLVKAFNGLIDLLALKPEGYNHNEVQQIFYICHGSSEDAIPESELASNYWIPVSEGIRLLKGDKDFGVIKPGFLVGGDAWKQSSEIEDQADQDEWHLKIPKKKADQPLDTFFLLFVIPKKSIPWLISDVPSAGELQNQIVPLMQSLVTRILENIAVVSEIRDSLMKRFSQIVEVIVTEKKVREFENNRNRIPQAKYNRILKLIYETLGIALEKRQSVSSEAFSKQLYNEIVKQTKKDFPNLTAEEQGNKAYTLWRFMQSEIVSKIYLEESSDIIKLDVPKSTFLQIREDIEAFFKEKDLELPKGACKMREESGEINMSKMIQTESKLKSREYLEILKSVLDIVEQRFVHLVGEATGYKSRLDQISAIQTEFDVNEIQSKFILDAIAKLQKALQNESPETG